MRRFILFCFLVIALTAGGTAGVVFMAGSGHKYATPSSDTLGYMEGIGTNTTLHLTGGTVDGSVTTIPDNLSRSPPWLSISTLPTNTKFVATLYYYSTAVAHIGIWLNPSSLGRHISRDAALLDINYGLPGAVADWSQAAGNAGTISYQLYGDPSTNLTTYTPVNHSTSVVSSIGGPYYDYEWALNVYQSAAAPSARVVADISGYRVVDFLDNPDGGIALYVRVARSGLNAFHNYGDAF